MIASGGFLGAILRFQLSKMLNEKRHFPFGTLFVNLMGSFLIGILLGVQLSIEWKVFLISGFLGALTTFSTLQKEAIDLWEKGNKLTSFSYMLITYSGGILLAAIGYFFTK